MGQAWAPPQAEVLGVTNYNPGTLSNLTTSSTSLTDADSTNLIVVFTAPLSGNVLVRLTGVVNPSTGSVSGDSGFWGLRESTSNIAGPAVALRYPGGTSAQVAMISVAFKITGLTPGSSHTYKWAFCTNSGTTGLRVGGSATTDLGGPASLEVLAL